MLPIALQASDLTCTRGDWRRGSRCDITLLSSSNYNTVLGEGEKQRERGGRGEERGEGKKDERGIYLDLFSIARGHVCHSLHSW